MRLWWVFFALSRGKRHGLPAPTEGTQVGLPYTKPPLSFDEQVDRLTGRGMTIGDRDRAREVLSHISYYRLSAYWYPFREHPSDRFHAGTSFEQILAVYEFDRELRLLVLDAIERAEVMLRTTLTYEVTHAATHGFAHQDPRNFTDSSRHQRWYSNLLDDTRRASERFLEHFRTKYDGFPEIPLWMASEVMSFGMLSMMLKMLTHPLQNRVAATLGVHREVAVSWCHSVAHVRNICAHHGRLWNRELGISPKLPRHQPEWRLPSNGRVYAVLCILRRLTENCSGGDQWAVNLCSFLSRLDGSPERQRSMGIPADWKSSAFWRSATKPGHVT